MVGIHQNCTFRISSTSLDYSYVSGRCRNCCVVQALCRPPTFSSLYPCMHFPSVVHFFSNLLRLSWYRAFSQLGSSHASVLNPPLLCCVVPGCLGCPVVFRSFWHVCRLFYCSIYCCRAIFPPLRFCYSIIRNIGYIVEICVLSRTHHTCSFSPCAHNLHLFRTL